MEILEVDLVEPLRDEDHVGHHHLLDRVALGCSVAEDLGLIELSALGDLIPYLLQVGLFILVEALEQVSIELSIIDEFLNSKSSTLGNKVFVPEGRSANLVGHIFIEGMNLLIQLLLDNKIRRLDNFIEDGYFLGDRLFEADLLKHQADIIIIGSIVNIVAFVENAIG